MFTVALILAAALPVPGRSIVVSQQGVAASSQPLAAQVAAHVMERGGNAIDAAIAANATQGLLEPTSNGIGGDLFAIIYIAKEDKLYGLNASGWSPAGMTLDFLKSKGVEGELPLRGVYTVTVPGTVSGWAAMHDKFARLPLAADLAPAIWYAEHGFPLMEVTAGLWSRSLKLLSESPESIATWLVSSDGQPARTPHAGEVFKNPNLAKSLKLIAERGRDGFYKGPAAQSVVDVIREQGGVMTMEDLAQFKPEWVTPIQTNYRGWTVSELPPNGQGIAALEMLNMMEQFPLAEYGFHTVKSLHAMIEVKKLAYADLLQYIGDPKFSKQPVTQLLSKTLAAERAKLVDQTKANCNEAPSKLAGMGSDTIYMSIVDGDGNIVSLIQSNYAGFGSGLTPKGAGFMLQNRGNLFSLKPGQPNTIEGHKRPLHTIIPAFMQKGDTRIGFGIMGGWNQAQAHAQFVADVVDYGMTIQQALEAGRFTKTSFDGCDIEIETSVPQDVRDQLTSMGHKLDVKPLRTSNFGYGQAVIYDRKTGVKFGASDPRHDGEAVPVTAPYFDKSR
jgi:gamma-glutamyltranspeptidase/glutathione hydrolase